MGLIITSNLVYCWYNTTIAEKILSKFIKTNLQNPMYNDLMDSLHEKHPLLSELLSCELCFSHWVSLFVAIAICFFFAINPLLSVIAMFSWPRLIYIINHRL